MQVWRLRVGIFMHDRMRVVRYTFRIEKAARNLPLA